MELLGGWIRERSSHTQRGAGGARTGTGTVQRVLAWPWGVFQAVGLQRAARCSPRVAGSWRTPSNGEGGGCTSLALAGCLGSKSSLCQLSLFGLFLGDSHTPPTKAAPSSLVLTPQILPCVPIFDIGALDQSRLLLAWFCSPPRRLPAANKVPLTTKAKSAPCSSDVSLGSAAFRPSFAACPGIYKGGISPLPAPS